MMGKTKKVIKLLRVNWHTMAWFELLYKLLSLAVFTPLCWTAFNGIMRITGYEYLTIENILSFLTNPVTIAALFLLLAAMTVYTMIDIGAVIFLLDQSYQGVKADLQQTCRYAVRNAVKVFHRKNIFIAFAVLFLIPFLNIGVASSYVGSISIPEFILDFIAKNNTLLILFSALLLALLVLMLRWLYAFHYFTLEGCGFKEARKKSAKLSRKNKAKDLAVLLGIQVLVYALYFILLIAGIGLAVFLGSLCSKWQLLGIVSASVVWVFLLISLLLVSALVTPVSYACISMLYYEHKERRQEEIIHASAGRSQENKRRKKLLHAAEGVLLAVSVACCSFYLYSIYHHKVSIQVEHIRTMQVTAHRGASAYYPENTMAAFEGARELGADWIELDVQQSRDGQIFVMHDADFRRTAGVDRSTWDMDYDEIRTLDVGSFFDRKFEGERAPLLTDVIAFAKKSGMKLNIEMKPSGHERDFEKSVAGLIAEEAFWDQCVVTSLEYHVLERIKEYDSRVQTVYVMSFAYGDIRGFEAADHFSIEASSISPKMVSDIHNAGKELYAWTVNTQEGIDRMIDLGVDHIVTDDITLAKECIFLSKTSDVVSDYVKWISGMLAE
ncbi:MAG: glycerophosphodiester phosphodiesterase [Eubacterium sp.]|nr:glycerophosphodiester phosphodiesterase [Eubacterium sp.]